MLDILCVGDSVVDVFLKIPEENPHFGLDKEKNMLFISYGEKINIDKYVIDVGGNATNTAIGISRLGLKVGLCAEIGKDEFSQKILSKLEKENINRELIILTETEKTSFSVGINYKGERTLFVEHIKRDHNFDLNKLDANFIYLTSLGNKWEEAYQKILELVGTKNIKLAFNPGTLQIEKRDKLIMEIIENTDFLFVNKEEAEELLYGKELEIEISDQNSLIKKLLYGLKSLGAKNVIITDSSNGSYLQSKNDDIFHLGIIKADVVEKTGAGDAYTAGFLSAVLNGLTVEEAMIWGTVNSSSVIQKIGAEEGLLTKQEIGEKIKSNGNFQPEAI